MIPNPAICPIKILAHIDVGFGNKLAIHGTWAGKGNWEIGVPMKCIGPRLWEVFIAATQPIEYKLVLNQKYWEIGENHTANPGSSYGINPLFSVK